MSAAVRPVSALLVLAAGLTTRGASAATLPLHAVPAVQVIDAPVNGSAPGSIVLRNDGASTVVVDSIVADPGCDTAFVEAPSTGFMVLAGASHALAIMCSPAPASMQRCAYRARSSDGATLAAFEAVCAYSDATTLAASSGAIDFGAVPIGSPRSTTIALSNTGGAAIDKLFIETTDLTGNFTVAAPCNPDARACDAPVLAVAPGGSTNAVVTCAPRSAGQLAATLHITTSAGTRVPPIQLTCSGQPASAPVISVVPDAVRVGAVETMKEVATATVQIANAGTDMLKLSDIQLVDGGSGGAADWSYKAKAPCGAAIPPSCLLAAGQSVELDFVFDPSAIGVRDAILLINYRDTADRTTAIPLHGVGRGATLELVRGQTVLDFGAQPLDKPASLTFQVVNRGTREVAEGAIALTPSGPPFTVSPGPTFTVPVATPTAFTVTCEPTTVGTFTARAELTAGDVASAPIDVALRCTGDKDAVLTAAPPAILLGEVRVASAPVIRQVTIASSADVTLGSAKLESARPGMTLGSAPPALPTMLELMVSPSSDGDLANRIIATPSMGPARTIAIAGTAVTAAYSVPALVSLGTFCVQQPTMPRIVQLTSTGTATIGAMLPVLQSRDSPFDLELIAPLDYPATLSPGQRAVVSATPKRRAIAGFVTDDLTWMTDVAGATVARSKLTATFVDAGPAIAPDMLTFGQTPIHVDTRNAQQVTLQNCDVSVLQLESPQIGAPFSIDSPPPPNLLRPGQTVTFSIGFHPTKLGDVSKTLTITSPQLSRVLTVALTGTGTSAGIEPTGDGPTPDPGSTSFYSCSSCASGDAGLLAIAAAFAGLIAQRRRRRQR